MHLTLDEFCEAVKRLDKTNAEKAVALLWYRDLRSPDVVLSAGQLAHIMVDHHVGNPNPSQLTERIRESKLTHESRAGFRLMSGSRKLVRGWLPHDIDGLQPTMDHSTGYLGDAIWNSTNTYVEGVCRQLNGCYKSCFYDAAAVMLRRLAETLIIEAYEAVGQRADILDGSNNPFLLDQLISVAVSATPPGGKGIPLGREAKTGLTAMKKLGNRSAHNRRVLANRSDLDDVRSGARTAVEELIVLAELKHT